ncbi:MAG: NTP transferase domain-containing protein [Coriobacteriia bacterium]|nr:NTP transferase domain-containing protein [Coriobacteriia bacterium]
MGKQATLVILAAGMGSRYGGLKQLDPVGPQGEAILDYSVYDAIRAGFNKVVFIIRRDFEEQFKNQVAKKYTGHIDVDFVFQDMNDLPEGYTAPEGREKPWGTVHAMLATKDAVNTPFAVINADDFYGADAYKALYEYLTGDELDRSHSAMVGFKLSNTLSENGSVARGVCEKDDDGNLTKIAEYIKIFKTQDGAEDRNDQITKFSGEEPVSMNMWAFDPRIFADFEKLFENWLEKNVNVEKSECFIPVEVDNLIKAGITNVKVLPTTSKWFGVTYKEDKPDVVATIKQLTRDGLYPDPLFK